MKEILLYAIAGLSSIFVLGYSVHMFVGGLVTRETEIAIIVIACIIGALVIGLMSWDVARQRRQK